MSVFIHSFSSLIAVAIFKGGFKREKNRSNMSVVGGSWALGEIGIFSAGELGGAERIISFKGMI